MRTIEPSAPALLSTPSTTPAVPEANMSDAATSPAESEKTVIARAFAGPRPRPRKMVAQPGTCAAVFSTDGGRLSRCSVPTPPPPVIVRSVQVQGVVDSANYWRRKCPDFYPCFFPGQGWSITDLWDESDIHLDSPDFLEEVLHFIIYDNHVGASKFAQAWCQRNPGKMEKLSDNLVLLKNSNDQFARVDEFFTEQELEECPRQFLFHALCLLKETMHIYMANYHPVPTADLARLLVNTEPLPTSVDDYAATTDLKQQLPVATRLQSTIPGHTFTSPAFVPAAPNGYPMRHPSFAPSQPPKLIFDRGNGALKAHRPATNPAYVGGQPRHTKRPGRSGSNPLAQPSQMYGHTENVRLPSAGYMRHPSGPYPNGGPHQYVSSMPMGPCMAKNLPPVAHVPPNAAMTSPPVHPAQISYPPMMPPAMFTPSGSAPPQLHDPAYQHYGSNVPGPRVIPFMDIVNNTQYLPPQGLDVQGVPRHNSQNMKQPILYNPYDGTRPDKAGFATTGVRKGSRGNFTNNVRRGRKHSAGAFDRSVYSSYPSDHLDNGAKSSPGFYIKGPQVRDTKHNFEPDSSITKDKESGCDYSFIGPKNTIVRQLFVRYFADDITGPEIHTLFENHADVTPTGVEIKFAGDRKESHHAFVSFASTDDARKALETSLPLLRGKEVQVSVAKRYFQLSAHPRPTTQDQYRSANNTSISAKSNPYSPQDARSDLSCVNEQQQPATPVMRGSLEVRKAKKSLPAKKSHVEQNDQQDNVLDAGRTSTKPAPTLSGNDSAKKHEMSAHSQNTDAKVPVVATDTAEATMDRAAGSPTKPAVIEATTEGEFAEPSSLGEFSPTETIIESIPTDTQAPLLTSPTKVTLPPSVDQVTGSVQEEPAAVVTTGYKRVGVIAAAPQAQEEATSDDDQRNDLSFHSAQESQPEFETIEGQKHQEAGDAHVKDKMTDATATKGAQLDIQQSEVPKPQYDQKIRTCDTLAPRVQQEMEVTPAAGKSAAETGKKQGAKQTESLNPYSKAYKTQLKKQRDKERKQKRLREEEKRKNKDEMVGKRETQSEVKGGNVEIFENENESKTVSSSVAEDLVQVEKGDQVQAQQFVEIQKPKQIMLDQPGGSSTPVQSHEETILKVSLAATPKGPSVRFEAPPNDQDQAPGTEKKIKAVPPTIAVPNLELLKKKSSPTSATTTPHTAYSTATPPSFEKVSIVNTSGDTPEAPQDGKAPPGPHDAASVSSSTTLRGPSPPPMSLSPTERDFHTPLQTPTTLEIPTVETTKKNNRKKKSKKKSTNTESASAQGADEPFQEQLSQVNTQTGYYSLRGSDLPAQEVFGRKEDKGPKSLIRQVQAYVKEKASGYSRAPESAWDKDNRKQTEKMTPAESEHLMTGQRLAVGRAMAHYTQDASVPDGSPYKAEEAGKVPLFGE